jgi:choline-sulfatase
MKPNVLFITADQLRWDALHYNGNPEVFTPNLDGLARRGVVFSRAYTPNPICVPARASITTGCYSHKCTGTKQNEGGIKEGFPLIAKEFSRRGYDTYAMGKLHYLPYRGPGEHRTTYGFETVELTESGRILQQYDPEGKLKGLEDYHDYLTEAGWGGYTRANGLGNNDVFAAPSLIPPEHQVDAWIAGRTVFHLEQHLSTKGERPFFMWTSFPKPHSAYDPPKPYDSFYDPRALSDPVGSIEDIRERGLELLYKDYLDFGWDKLSPEAKKTVKAYYYGLVTFQDSQIGRILAFLRKKNLLKNTLIVFTSDHGDMLGDFGLYFKRVFYEASVKVPMIMSWEGKLPQGKRLDVLCGLQDLLPTLINFTEQPLGQEVDGIDLFPTIFEERTVRDYYVSQCNDDPEQQYMIVEGDYKYIYHQCGGIEELYDLVSDPGEKRNLAAENPERTERFRERLVLWCRGQGDKDMLDGAGLKKSPPQGFLGKKPVPQPFGRRYY